MKKTLMAFAIIALLPGGAALADDNCHAPRDQWQPREAAIQVAQDHGWTVRHFKIDDGCYEIEGRDGAGRTIEVKLDPATLQIVETDDDDDDDDRGGARNPGPAGAGAPPQNGLFGNGAPPKVQVN